MANWDARGTARGIATDTLESEARRGRARSTACRKGSAMATNEKIILVGGRMADFIDRRDEPLERKRFRALETAAPATCRWALK